MRLLSPKQAATLRRIRYLRRACLSIIFAFLPFCALLASFGQPLLLLVAVVALFVLGLLLQYRLNHSRCPCCGEYFFTQTLKRNQYQPHSSLSFPPQRRCQHCGLDLYRRM